MKKQKHFERKFSFRKHKKKIYLEYLNIEALDLDNINEKECGYCLYIYSIKKYKKCPLCNPIKKIDLFDFSSYINTKHHSDKKWKTTYHRLTMKNLFDNYLWYPNHLDAKNLNYEKMIYVLGRIVYFGEKYEWINQQLFYHENIFEELSKNPIVKEKALEWNKYFPINIDNDSDSESNSESDYDIELDIIEKYIVTFYKKDYLFNKYLPFRKVLGINFCCDICYKNSSYLKNGLTHFNIFFTSRNCKSQIECLDNCDCPNTRITNYDYCQKCFFNIALQKSLRNLLFCKVFTKYKICDTNLLYYYSNTLTNYDY